LDQTFRGTGGFGSTGIAGIDLGLRDAISRHMPEDNFGKTIHRALENKSVPFPGRMVAEDWTADGKLLLFQERCYIPANQLLRRRILQLYHDSPAAGHLRPWMCHLSTDEDQHTPNNLTIATNPCETLRPSIPICDL
jgi:hypothetical protein